MEGKNPLHNVDLHIIMVLRRTDLGMETEIKEINPLTSDVCMSFTLLKL